MIKYISVYLLIIQSASAEPPTNGLKRKRPRNFQSINHDNFVRFWNLNFDDQNGVLVHTGEKTIAYSIITNGTLSHEFWNLVEDCNSVTQIDYILSKKILVWADQSNEKEERKTSINFYSKKDNSWRFDLPSYKANLQSLAVDWISEKIYWYDTFEQAIFVCTLYGDICKPIVYKNLQSTRSARFLQIDSARSRLYFDNAISIQSSYIPTHVIESVSLDGSDRRNLFGPDTRDSRTQEIGSKGFIKGIQIQEEKVFWASNNLYYISIENGATKIVYADKNIGKLSSLKGYFYWTDERQHRNTVSSINYPSRQPIKKSTEFEMNNNVGISFHRVLSSSNQPTDQVTSYNQACKEKNCSHLCLRRSSYTGPDVTCACPAGIDFKIDASGTKSKTECNQTPQRIMAISSPDDVRYVSMDTPFLHSNQVFNKQKTIAVAIDPIQKFIYFLTYLSKGDECRSCLPIIARVNLDGSGYKTIISSGIGHSEGLALDYYNQLLYWTDMELGHIEMASLKCVCDSPSCKDKGGNCRKIVAHFDNPDRLRDKPRRIVVGNGWIYWSDWGDDRPRIEKALQDGTQRTVLIDQDIKWPNGLSLSDDYQFLYYLEAASVDNEPPSIYQVNLAESGKNGQIRKKIYTLRTLRVKYWTLSFFQNRIYYGGNDYNSKISAIKPYKRANENSISWIADDETPFNQKLYLSMHIETADITSNLSINPELDSCKYIYIPPANQKRHRCACPDDLQPIDGEPWCRSRDFKIIFVGTRSNLGQGRMEVSTFDPENNQGNWDRGQGRPKEFETDAEQTLWSLDYHYSHQLMFYFDVRNGKRSLLSRRNSDGAIDVLVDVGVDDSTKLTVDWLGDSIYFINRDTNVFGHNSNPRIEQVSLEGRERRTVIRETELGSPSDLKVDPKEGFIFWVDWDYKIDLIDKGKTIEVNRCMARATMAGDDVTAIVTDIFVGERISTFTLDYRKKKIYFIDYDTAAIYQIGYNNKPDQKPKVIRPSQKQFDYKSLTFYADTLYWIEETKRSQDYTLKWIDTSSGGRSPASDNNPRQYQIRKNHDLTIETILARAPQIGWSRCQMKDNCPGLCVTTPTSQGQRPRNEPVYDSECVCPSHFKLTESESGQITGQTKCSPPSDFLLFSRSRSISRMVKDKLLDKHDQKFDFDQTLSISEVDSPKKIHWDSKNRRIYWLNENGKIYSSLENGDNLTELDLDGDYARGFDIYTVGNIIYWSNAKKNQIYLTKMTPDGSGEQLGSLKTDNIYPEEITISSSSGFLFFTNNCGPRYTPGDECRLIFRSKMNGEKLCSVLHGTPKITSLVAHQSPKSRNLVELYWNDSNKIRQISVDITVNTEVCNKPDVRPVEFKPSQALSISVLNQDNEQRFYWIEDNEQIQTIYEASDRDSDRHKLSKKIRSFEGLTSLLVVDSRGDDQREIDHLRSQCELKRCSDICQIEREQSVMCSCLGNQILKNNKCTNQCAPDQFMCTDRSGPLKGCINQFEYCDGNQDCEDGSDEPHTCQKCDENQFQCKSKDKCIAQYMRCNNVADCEDGSDEQNCPITCLHSNEWQCSDQLSCIKQDQRCDGIRNCKDNSDEGDCQKPPIIKTKNVISWSILAAGLIVSVVLMVFCILNRKRSSNNPSNPQINIPLPPYSNRDNTNITISITATHSQMPPGSSSSSVPQSNPAPPNSLVSHVIHRRPIGYRAPPTIRSDSDSEQCLTNRRSGSGCSEPPPYPDCISSSSSLIHEPYPRPRPRPCPTPVTDKE